MFSKYLGIKPVYFGENRAYGDREKYIKRSRCNQLNPVEEGMGQAGGGGGGRQGGGGGRGRGAGRG